MPVKAAKDMLEATKKRFHEVNVHKNEPKFIFTQIAEKQKSVLTKLVNSVKKKEGILFS